MESEQLQTVNERLDRIEAALSVLVKGQSRKDWYTTDCPPLNC